MASPFELMFNPEALAASGSPFGNIAQDIASLVQLMSQSQGTPSPLQASLPVQGNPFQQLQQPAPQAQPQIPLPQPAPLPKQGMPQAQGEPGLPQEAFDARFPQAGDINSGAEAMRDPKNVTKKIKASGDGILEPGNIDLGSRPTVKNQDGTISTVRSIDVKLDNKGRAVLGFPGEGRRVLIPTVNDSGEVLTDAQAVQNYNATGKHLGKFVNAQTANSYAARLHQDQDQYYSGKAQAQPIGYLFADKQRSNTMHKHDRLDSNLYKDKPRDMLADRDYNYDLGKTMLKNKMGIDDPRGEKFDDGPTLGQKIRDKDLNRETGTADDLKYFEGEMEKGQMERDYYREGTSSDDAWEQQWKRLDQKPEFRAKVQKINHESYNHGDVDVIRDVETSPVLNLMRRKALMHLAGDVVPLPITPGPNAGLPSGAAIMSGQRQIRNGGSNVVPHPAREDWYRRVSDRLRA